MGNFERERPRNVLKYLGDKIKGPEVIFAAAAGQINAENGFHMDTAARFTASFIGALFVIIIGFVASEEYSYRKYIRQEKNMGKNTDNTNSHKF